MGSFTTDCKYCDEEIKMSDEEEGRWLPYEIDGFENGYYTIHDCRPKDEEYEKECEFCGELIEMSKKSGKWLPYDIDTDSNERHTCNKEIE